MLRAKEETKGNEITPNAIWEGMELNSVRKYLLLLSNKKLLILYLSLVNTAFSIRASKSCTPAGHIHPVLSFLRP